MGYRKTRADTARDQRPEGEWRTMLPINRMRCEYLCQPLGVDTPAPYLSWAVSPACGGNADARVLVSYEEDFSSLLWDSGWTARQCAVTYAGEPLRSGSRVWWKVLIRPAGQEDSIAEGVSWFETGLMRETDWHGQWIRADAPLRSAGAAPYFPFGACAGQGAGVSLRSGLL